MVRCEDMDCGVCYQPYSRQDRIPRVLHCRHTFCTTCLETMSQPRNGLLTVRCPLCRQTTCVGRGLSLQEALWVNSRFWDNISESTEEEEEEEAIEGIEEEMTGNLQTHAPSQATCPATKLSRTKLKLPAFLRKFSLSKLQHQNGLMFGCDNVEIKSWRRLSTAETF
ncbi:hypothetical protein UPYG_G00040080 [Umbra pygmaea]|uniref:RING-type domain-containing protein n=1 Tax=Umbra pygmaea TaxID=75934 RepID=A0ABD0XPV2_UMBPY